jgi:hypothetical protein
VIGVAIIVLFCIPLALLPIGILRLRGKRLEDSSLIQRPPAEWKQADRKRRRRIWRAVMRGEAVRSPADARLALLLIDWMIEHRQRSLSFGKSFRAVHYVWSALFLFALIFSLKAGSGFRPAYLFPLGLLALGAFARLRTGRLEERLERSKRLNEPLAALDPSTQNDSADSWAGSRFGGGY